MRTLRNQAAWRNAAAVLAASLLLAGGTARADHQETLVSAATFGPAGTAANTQGTFTVAGTPILSRIRVDTTGMTFGGSGSFASEATLRLIAPGGSPTIDIRLHPQASTTPDPAPPSASGAGVTSGLNANGSWTYQFFESFDDGGTAAQDATVNGITITWESPETITPTAYTESFTNFVAAGSPRVGFYASDATSASNLSTNSSLGWLRATATAVLGAGAVTFATTTPAGPASLTSTTWGQWLADGFGNVGTTGAVRLNTGATTRRDFLISPIFAIPGSGSYRLRYDLALTTNGGTAGGTFAAGTQNLIVLMSDDGGATWTGAAGNRLRTYDNTTAISNTGQNDSVLIPPAAAGTNRRFAFYAGSTVTTPSLDIHIDNFTVEEVPTTPVFTSSSASGNATAYQYRNSGTYSFVIANSGTVASTDTAVTIPLPAGLTYNSGSVNTVFTGMAPGTSATYNSGLNRIEFSAQPIDPAANATITFNATVSGTGAQLVEATITDSSLGAALTRSVTTTGVNLPAAAGADAFYDVLDSYEPGGPTFNYIARPGTGVTLFNWADDDAEVNITPPFPVFVYGQLVTGMRVGANGAIFLNQTTGDIAFGNTALSAVTTPLFVAPWWDDLDTGAGVQTGWWVDGAAPNRRLVIEYVQDHFNVDLANPATFQVAFHEDSQDILFQYQDVDMLDPNDGGASATVGIVGTPTTEVRQYSFNNAPAALENNLAILFDGLQGLPSLISVGNASVSEGNSGTTILSVPVTITNPPGTAFSFDWETNDGTATLADNDYVDVPVTTVNLAGGTTTANLDITINGDTAFEPGETISVVISNAVGGASIAGAGTATATISNDDLPTNHGFAIDLSTDTAVFIDQATAVESSVATGFTSQYFGGDFEDTTGSFVTYNRTNTRIERVNPLSGAVTVGPTVTGLPASHQIVSLSFNPADGQMWALTINFTTFVSSTIGTLNLTTGAYTQVLNTGTTPVLGTDTGLAIAHDATGQLYYMHDVGPTFGDFTLASVSGTTVTDIGATGLNSLAFIEMDFDPQTGVLYMPFEDGSTVANLVSFNLATGAPTTIAPLASLAANHASYGVAKNYTPSLTVTNAFGTATPAGTTNSAWGTTVNASVTSPVPISGTEQQAAIGFTGTGSATSGAGASTSFTLRVPSTLTWNFEQQFTLTTTINPPGSGTVDLADGFYGGTQNLTATPNGGFVFVNFTGDITTASNPASVTFDAPKAITANFAPVSTVIDWSLY